MIQIPPPKKPTKQTPQDDDTSVNKDLAFESLLGQTSVDDPQLVIKDMSSGNTGPEKDPIKEVADSIVTMEPYAVPQSVDPKIQGTKSENINSSKHRRRKSKWTPH